MAAYKIGLLTIYGTKKHKGKNYKKELRSVEVLFDDKQNI